MRELVKYAIVTNVSLGLLFIFSNCYLWNTFSGYGKNIPVLISSSWNPLTITVVFHTINIDGELATVMGFSTYFNAPFVLFWAQMALNLFFILRLQRGKQDEKA